MQLPSEQDSETNEAVRVSDVVPVYCGRHSTSLSALERLPSAAEAFEMYIDGTKRWAMLAREGRVDIPEGGVPP
jgi:hypothetical protein